jgi:hypothetical protein
LARYLLNPGLLELVLASNHKTIRQLRARSLPGFLKMQFRIEILHSTLNALSLTIKAFKLSYFVKGMHDQNIKTASSIASDL